MRERDAQMSSRGENRERRRKMKKMWMRKSVDGENRYRREREMKR